MTFAENEVHLALRVLNTYEGERSDRVHKAVIKLSNGDLHLLACWAGGATQQDVEPLLWFAGATEPGATGKQIFGAQWMNSFYDRNRLASPGDVS